MAEEITLTIAGQVFGGWTSVEVSRRLDALAGSFNMEMTERWPGHPDKWQITAGSPCSVAVGKDKVFTGYVDEVDPSYDAGRHQVRVTGREKTADLIDCSAIHKPGSWKNRRIEQIAAELASPFGIATKAVTATGAPFPAFALQQGETVFEAIDRMAKQRGLLPVTNEDGDLEFRRPGQTKASYRLVEGDNIEGGSFRNDAKARFSDYIIKGHGVGADFLSGTKASRPSASAKDPGMPRYRPLLIVHNVGATTASLTDRAKWEATTRAAKGQEATLKVVGWRSRDGALYRFDQLVTASAPTLGVEGELLVSGVKYSLDSRGGVTDLTLVRKEAFSLLALPAKRGKGPGVDFLETDPND